MRSVTPYCQERLILLALLAAALTLASGRPSAFAEQLKSPPVGARVFYTGHSFHVFVPRYVTQMAAAAGIEGHQQVGVQGIGGSRVDQHWDLPDEKNKAKKALSTGEVDVFTMAAHLAVPDRGIASFTELGLKHNPELRLLVQASWYPWDVPSKERRIRDNSQRDTMKIEDLQAAIDSWRTQLEHQADELNRERGRKAVFIVPVGDAVVKLRAMVVAGKYPGVAAQSALFSDAIGHGGPHIQVLASYCNFAAIYRSSPIGLNIQTPGLDDAQQTILQTLAWEAVANYSHSGVAAPATASILNPFVTPVGWPGLLRDEAVQQEAGLSVAQAARLRELLEQLSDKPQQAEEAIRRMVAGDQLARIEQLNWQREGGYALFDPRISQALSVSEPQSDKLRTAAAINAAEHQKMRDFMKLARFRSPEGMEQYVEEHRNPANERLLSVLREDQRAKLKSLLGKPLRKEK